MSQRRGGASAWLAAALVGMAAVGAAPPGVAPAATTALIMGGTLHPLLGEPGAFVDRYLADSLDFYIAPTGTARNGPDDPGQYQTVALWTPEEFWPMFGSRSFDQSVAAGAANVLACLSGGDSCVVAGSPDWQAGGPAVVFGYSQSARVATVVQRMLEPGSADVSFVLAANPNRPNGGILQRFNGLSIPFLNVTFDGSTPTGEFPTADISRQYDGWSDFPARPLNLLATLNAVAGIAFLHQHYTMAVDDSMIQSVTGETTYYLIPTQRLPLLMPLQFLGVPSPILTALDAPLRVMIEWAYDRVDPGTPTTASVFGRVDPLTALGALAAAIPTGIDDGLAEAGFGRPLGTAPAGPFGVGAPASIPKPAAPVAGAVERGPSRVSAAPRRVGLRHADIRKDSRGDGPGDDGRVGARRHRQP